jgi:hypothetical protein
MKHILVFSTLVFIVACTPIMPSPTPISNGGVLIATKTVSVPTAPTVFLPLSTLTPPCTPTASPTAPYLTSTPTHTPIASPTVTATYTPNPAETILISYYQSGTDGWPDWPDDCLLWLWRYQLVIYEDGHLIVHTKQGIFEKSLSSQEMDKLLRQIEATGFFRSSIETDQMGRDLIYTTPISHFGEGGSTRTLMVKGKHVSIYDSLNDYVMEPVKEVDQIISNYRPTGMKRYVPEELWLEVIDVTASDLNHLNYPFVVKPSPTIMPWSAELPTLAELADLHDVAVFRGAEVPPLLITFPSFPMVRLFSEHGREYSVVACPILPEQK